MRFAIKSWGDMMRSWSQIPEYGYRKKRRITRWNTPYHTYGRGDLFILRARGTKRAKPNRATEQGSRGHSSGKISRRCWPLEFGMVVCPRALMLRAPGRSHRPLLGWKLCDSSREGRATSRDFNHGYGTSHFQTRKPPNKNNYLMQLQCFCFSGAWPSQNVSSCQGPKMRSDRYFRY